MGLGADTRILCIRIRCALDAVYKRAAALLPVDRPERTPWNPPRVTLLQRTGNRIILNQDELIQAILDAIPINRIRPRPHPRHAQVRAHMPSTYPHDRSQTRF